MVAIEGIYIFDEHNNAILEHVYTGRPPAASVLLPAYLSSASNRPPVAYLGNLKPPTLVCSIIQDRLLFLCPSTSDAEPLTVLEFLHRLADALEDFLGSPLLASKIDGSYDVVAQIVAEISDAGIISTTEPNALQEVVEAPSWMGNLFGGFGLPAASPSLQTQFSLPRAPAPFMPGTGNTTTTSDSASAIPWRRSSVRHTSNELYVDIVEKLSIIMAPSGRPLSAIAHGTIIFNAKISGVPDLLLSLTSPGGVTGIQNAMDLPCFHPCVRLAKWRERPGELSFVPPDGKFVLASYQSELLPDLFGSDVDTLQPPKLDLPVWIETSTAQLTHGGEMEVRLFIKQSIKTNTSSNASIALNRNLGPLGAAPSAFGPPKSTVASAPAVEDIRVKIPISGAIRTVDDLKTARGEAHYLASEGIVEWRISAKEAATIPTSGITLRCTIHGQATSEDRNIVQPNGTGLMTDTFDYDEGLGSLQNGHGSHATPLSLTPNGTRLPGLNQQTASLMPRCATLSFNMRGWLASGIKVESLSVNARTSKGLGAGVTPYKGVKYHTVSRDGIEVRC